MFKSLYLFFKKSFTTKSQLILENVFLHKQLEIYQRSDPKLKISGTDRMFFSLMKDLLYNWKERLLIVKPNTLKNGTGWDSVISGNGRAGQKEEDLP